MYKIQNYKTSTGRICLMSCLSDIFNHYGLEVNESIIFALSEASLFYYQHFDLEEALKSNIPMKLFMLKIGGMQYDIPLMLQNTMQYFDIEAEMSSSLEVEEIKEFIIRHVEQQRPILALLSRIHLEYMDKNFRDNVTHSINIIGHCLENDELIISDTYIPTNPVQLYEGSLSITDYHNSLVSSKDMFNKEFSFRNVAFLPRSALPFTALPFSTMLQPLKNIAANFLNSKCHEGGILTGFGAYKQFLADFEEWLQVDTTPIVSSLMKFTHHRLTNFGGPVVTNMLLSEYMGYIICRKNDPKYNDVKGMFSDLSKKWFIIANLFGKAGFIMTKESNISLHKRVTDVLQLEEAVYRKIMEF